MKKPVVLLLVVVGVVLALGLVAVALLPRKQTTPTNTTDTTTTDSVTPSTDTSSTDSTQQQVVIKDFSFTPAKLTIKKGTQVTWINQDDVKHNVVADDETNGGGLPGDASLMAKGQSYSHTFDTVGSFTYHCNPHPNMKGVIEVVQ